MEQVDVRQARLVGEVGGDRDGEAFAVLGPRGAIGGKPLQLAGLLDELGVGRHYLRGLAVQREGDPVREGGPVAPGGFDRSHDELEVRQVVVLLRRRHEERGLVRRASVQPVAPVEHEDLERGDAEVVDDGGDLVDVLLHHRREVEGVVDERAALRPLQHLGEECPVRPRAVQVVLAGAHVVDGCRDPALRAGAAFDDGVDLDRVVDAPVLMRVHDPGDGDEPGGVEGVVSVGAGQLADGGDAPADDTDVGHLRLGVVVARRRLRPGRSGRNVPSAARDPAWARNVRVPLRGHLFQLSGVPPPANGCARRRGPDRRNGRVVSQGGSSPLIRPGAAVRHGRQPRRPSSPGRRVSPRHPGLWPSRSGRGASSLGELSFARAEDVPHDRDLAGMDHRPAAEPEPSQAHSRGPQALEVVDGRLGRTDRWLDAGGPRHGDDEAAPGEELDLVVAHLDPEIGHEVPLADLDPRHPGCPCESAHLLEAGGRLDQGDDGHRAGGQLARRLEAGEMAVELLEIPEQLRLRVDDSGGRGDARQPRGPRAAPPRRPPSVG